MADNLPKRHSTVERVPIFASPQRPTRVTIPAIMGVLQRIFRPSPARFARIMIRALHKAGVTDDIEYDADEFKLIIGGEIERHAIDAGIFQSAVQWSIRGPRHAVDGVVRRQSCSQSPIYHSRHASDQNLLAHYHRGVID